MDPTAEPLPPPRAERPHSPYGRFVLAGAIALVALRLLFALRADDRGTLVGVAGDGLAGAAGAWAHWAQWAAGSALAAAVALRSPRGRPLFWAWFVAVQFAVFATVGRLGPGGPGAVLLAAVAPALGLGVYRVCRAAGRR